MTFLADCEMLAALDWLLLLCGRGVGGRGREALPARFALKGVRNDKKKAVISRSSMYM